jgi:hypothetical protein
VTTTNMPGSTTTRPPFPWRLLLLLTNFLLPTTTNAAAAGEGGTYTCDAALGDVPLTKARYASIQAGELADGFAAVTCIPTEAFMDHTTPLSFDAKMPNLISIGDRAFLGFKGGDFIFAQHSLPKLEHIGVEAFAQFENNEKPSKDLVHAIRLHDMPSLISVGVRAFQVYQAPYFQLEVNSACPLLEVIGGEAFNTCEYATGSEVILTNLNGLRSVGALAFNQFNCRPRTVEESKFNLVFEGVPLQLATIGSAAFRYVRR